MEGQSTLLGVYSFSAPRGNNDTGKRHVGKVKWEAAESEGAEGFLKCVRQTQLARSCSVSLKHWATVLFYGGLEIWQIPLMDWLPSRFFFSLFFSDEVPSLVCFWWTAKQFTLIHLTSCKNTIALLQPTLCTLPADPNTERSGGWASVNY